MEKTLAAKLRPGDTVIIHGETSAKISTLPMPNGELIMFEVDVPGWHGLPPYSHKELSPPYEETAAEWKARE